MKRLIMLIMLLCFLITDISWGEDWNDKIPTVKLDPVFNMWRKIVGGWWIIEWEGQKERIPFTKLQEYILNFKTKFEIPEERKKK